MIKFKDLLIEGFGSIIKPLALDLSVKGIFVVRGENGCGKTSIFNSFFWCLYGSNLKGVNLSSVVTEKEYRDSDFKGTRVVVSFEKEGQLYVVARHIDYKVDTFGIRGNSQLLVWKDSELLNAQHKDDYQKIIIDLLGIDSKVFLSSVLFGQRMKRFVEASPSDKRNIFESIFNLEFLDKAKDNSSVRLTEILDQINEKESLIKILISKIESDKKNLDYLTDLSTDYESKKSDKLSKLENDISLLRKDLKNATKKKVPRALKYDDELDSKIHKLSIEIEHLNSVKIVPPEKFDDKCPTCDRKLTPSKLKILKKTYEDSLAEYKDQVDKRDKELSSKNRSLTSLNKVLIKNKKASERLKEIDQINQFNVGIDNKIAQINSSITMLEGQIRDINDETPPDYKDKINELEISIKSNLDKIEAADLTIKDLKAKKEPIEWWKTVGFTSKGVKGYILNSALSHLNTSIKKYASRLGLSVRFSIDTSKASKPFVTKCFNGDVEMDYNQFSGGEQARIDIVTALALYDVVSSNHEFNLLIMDEVFEGLDSSGVEDVFDLIRMRSEGKTLFIISHLDQLDSFNTKRLDVYKTDSTYIS